MSSAQEYLFEAQRPSYVGKLPREVESGLTLLYQPMMSYSQDGWLRCRHVEALARWNHPRHGLLLPNSFLGLVERSEAMDALTDRVLSIALEQLAQLRSAGIDANVSVNIPANLVAVPGFDDRVLGALERFAVDGSRLTLELTERGALKATRHVVACLTRLRMHGLGISIDDFGSAYSSLLRLFELPFSELKIDQTLIQASSWSAEARTIIESVVKLAHSLGLTVCAEGVESAAQLSFLETTSCDRMQGFHLSAPLSSFELRSFLSRIKESQ